MSFSYLHRPATYRRWAYWRQRFHSLVSLASTEPKGNEWSLIVALRYSFNALYLIVLIYRIIHFYFLHFVVLIGYHITVGLEASLSVDQLIFASLCALQAHRVVRQQGPPRS